jgi:hypothetical protein
MSMDQDSEDVETNWRHVANEIKKSKDENKDGTTEAKVTNIQVAVRVRPLNSKVRSILLL